jgi:predicted O-methyltransferase YrrM
MAKGARAYQWLRDVTQVLVCDRFNPNRRHLAEAASTACRSLNFHSRCRIQAQPLSCVIQKLRAAHVPTVTLPGPSTTFGDVGSQSGYHTLGALVQGLQPATILEFGTYLGVSALAMMLNAPAQTRLFTVDLPQNARAESVPELNALDRRHIATSRQRLGEAFLESPLASRITQITADSMTFRAESVVARADLVYVDGGHSRPVITKDTENAFRVLSPDGTIVWDDYFHLYPDVVEFLDELSQQHELVGIEGTNYVVFSRRWAENRQAGGAPA